MSAGSNVDPALIGAGGLVLGGIIVQVGNLWTARQTRTLSSRIRKETADDELVRWDRERVDRQAQWQAEQEARAQDRQRENAERRQEWLREHRRAATVRFMATADDYRVAIVEVFCKRREPEGLGEFIARYQAGRYEMLLLFDPNIRPALIAHKEAIDALGLSAARMDTDFESVTDQVARATTLLLEAAKHQLDSN